MFQAFHKLVKLQPMHRGKVNFPNSVGWTPNKQFCFSRSATFFRYYLPIASYCTIFATKWSSNGRLEAVVSKVICSKSQRPGCSPLLFLFFVSSPIALFFVVTLLCRNIKSKTSMGNKHSVRPTVNFVHTERLCEIVHTERL